MLPLTIVHAAWAQLGGSSIWCFYLGPQLPLPRTSARTATSKIGSTQMCCTYLFWSSGKAVVGRVYLYQGVKFLMWWPRALSLILEIVGLLKS